MPQSLLSAWLHKPAAVATPPPAVVRTKSHEVERKNTSAPPAPADERPESNADTSTSSGSSLWPFSKETRPPLPSNVELRGPTKEDIPSFKQLNALLLPIPYPESFYREILNEEVDRNITLLALWHDDPSTIGKEKGRLVGAVRCRLLSQPPSSTTTAVRAGTKPMLYLSTLVLLSPYRGFGVAARMVDVLLRRAVDDYGIGSVGAHVWEANEVGLEWYRKRGFKEIAREQGYYRKLNPTGAVVMQRDVGVMDFAGR